jgi:signal peptidase II
MKRSQALVFVALLLVPVGCDHLAKQIARSTLTGSAGVSLAADTLRFELTHNPGAFLSLGAGLPSGLRQMIFLGLVPLLLTVFCILALRAGFSSVWSLLGLSLVAGGGIGNWLDRLQHGGAVTDFVSVGLGPLRTGVFNLADVFIVFGMALLLLSLQTGRPRRRCPEEKGSSS